MTGERILVTGVSTDAGISIVRQLVESGYDVIGADWRKLPFGLRSRHLCTVHVLPNPSDAAFDENLVDLIESLRPDAFLPLLETNVVASACRRYAEIRRLTAVNVPGPDAFNAAYNKISGSIECRELGIACPDAYTLEEATRLLTDKHGNIPVVIKPGFDQGMASGVEYARNETELQRGYASCKSRFGTVLLQEYIPGGASHMHTAVLLFDRHSELIAAFTMQKVRQWPRTGGITALGISTEEFHLVKSILPFFRKLRWSGAVEVEMKLDARDGKFKVIEINPRFPGYLRFPILAGLPLADLAASLALEERRIVPLKYPSYAVGMKYVNPGIFLRTVFYDLRSARGRAAALRKAFADLSGTARVFGNMLTDPLPMAGRFLLDIRSPQGRSTARRQ